MRRFTNPLYLAIGLTALALGLAHTSLSGLLSGQVVNEGLTVELVDLYQVPFTSATTPHARINVLRESPDGSGRLFVNDLNGVLYVIDGGQVQLYMDLRVLRPDLKTSPGIASGLVSFAFHPEFASNGLFYTVHSEYVGATPPNLGPALPSSIDQHSVLTEWQADDPSANAFSGTSLELMRIAAPKPFHNLGAIAFNPHAVPGDEDYGLLYLPSGDYGTGTTGQPEQLQRLDTPYGTLMRIDPLGGPFERNGITYLYGIPSTNPFADDGDPATLGEIYAYGFRNGHRIVFDADTGAAFLTDIGQGNLEEVNVVVPGANYGYPKREGSFVLDVDVDTEVVLPLPSDDSSYGFTYPVAQYDHDEGFAIAGGFVYRGQAVGALRGKFVFGDIVTGRLFYADVDELLAADDGDPATTATVHELNILYEGQPTTLLDVVRDALGAPSTNRTDLRFGMDASGELYLTTKQDGFVRTFADLPRSYSDDFDRSSLGPDWVVDQLQLEIIGDEIAETAPRQSRPAQARYRGGAGSGHAGIADQYAKIQIRSPATETPAGFIVRANDPSVPLGVHYEIHFKVSTGEWRWEYYDPDWQATLGSCAGDGAPVPLDWIGATLTGTGPDTRVALYRWDDDPDAGGAPDVASWGAPVCVLQSTTGPFADVGRYGGIRFYGSDRSDSHADNWFFGGLEQPMCGVDADCDDGTFCNGVEQCLAGACAAGPAPCSDAAHCDEGADVCLACVADVECDDGAFCNGSEVCGAGTCSAGADPCPGASCDEGSDRCLASCSDDAECDDGAFCNGVETCVAGICAAGVPPCVDPAHCDEGADVCLACLGDAECDDAVFCNGSEICSAGACIAGAAPCVDPAHCDEGVGTCLECLADAECDDAVFCNGSELCNAGTCAAGANPCPGEICEEVGQTCTAPSLGQYSDDFDRTSLGPDWVVDRLSFAIVDNELAETSPRTHTPAQMRWQGGVSGGDTGTPDQYGKLQIRDPLTTTPGGFILRANAPSGPLAAHYEMHFKPDSGEWRWEYYDPLWQATLGSCAGDGTLAALDWIGVTITGNGPDTEVSLYRWDADPDAGEVPDPAANWGPADCVLQSAAGPFADAGRHGGIRFYGSDRADSHADNWFFGGLVAPAGCGVDADCDDASFCSGVEQCIGGICVAGAPPCIDAAHCDEGGDVCLGCVADAECDDGDFCDGAEACSAGTCTPGTDPCPGAWCDEGADQCLVICSDSIDCDDGDFCNGTEICAAGTCEAGTPPCVDLAHCDEAADVCLACVADAECDDGSFCNGAEQCSAGSCVAGAAPCIDPAHCDEGGGICLECLANAECDDAVFCNGAETCNAGACAAGADPCPGGTCEEAGQTCTAPAVTHYSDDFDRGSLGPDWVVDALSLEIIGNELVETSPRITAPAQMRYRGGASGGDPGTPDQYAKLQIRSPLTTTPGGFILRANAPSGPLAAHYEVHFKPDSGEWRWEYYDPLWQATLGACAGDGTLAALDWVGVAITGSGPETEVSVYRWTTDPDAGGQPDPVANWGPADCVLQSGAGPFADAGHHGGIRFYGSDRTDSHADNWFFGGLSAAEPPPDPSGSPPDDPLFSELWGLHNEGQTGGTADADMDVLEAWGLTTGSANVVVAILDTGIDYTHPDLADNLWTNPGEIPGNGIDDDGNGYVDDTIGWDFYNNDNDPFDDGGHGTHLAGSIGAVGNNGIGLTGVNQRVRIMPLKITSSGQVGTIDAAISAIDYAVAMGAQVLSNSWAASAAWGEPGWDQPGFAPALQAAIEAANAAGVLFVATAGNSGEDKDLLPLFPGSYDNDNIVTVAATDENDAIASWSSFGATSVDVAAPGVGILSTVPATCNLLGPPPGGGSCDGSGYLVASGTSMATAYVAGVAALIHARFPGISLPALKARLLYNVDVLPDLVGITVSEGRVNAARALEDDTLAPGGIGDLALVGATSDSVTLGFTATGDDGAAGRASAYDIRYATAPIDAGNFASATPVASPPGPQTAGSAELVDVVGLAPSTSYYFAVRAIDNVGNTGGVSNSAMGTTAP